MDAGLPRGGNKGGVFKLAGEVGAAKLLIDNSICAGVVAINALLHGSRVNPDFLSEFFDGIGYKDVSVFFQVLPGEAIGRAPGRVVDILVLGAVCGLNDVENLVGLLQDGLARKFPPKPDVTFFF